MELFSQRRNVVKNIFFDGKPVDTMEMLRRYCDSVKKVSSENKKISMKKNIFFYSIMATTIKIAIYATRTALGPLRAR